MRIVTGDLRLREKHRPLYKFYGFQRGIDHPKGALCHCELDDGSYGKFSVSKLIFDAAENMLVAPAGVGFIDMYFAVEVLDGTTAAWVTRQFIPDFEQDGTNVLVRIPDLQEAPLRIPYTAFRHGSTYYTGHAADVIRAAQAAAGADFTQLKKQLLQKQAGIPAAEMLYLLLNDFELGGWEALRNRIQKQLGGMGLPYLRRKRDTLPKAIMTEIGRLLVNACDIRRGWGEVVTECCAIVLREYNASVAERGRLIAAKWFLKWFVAFTPFGGELPQSVQAYYQWVQQCETAKRERARRHTQHAETGVEYVVTDAYGNIICRAGTLSLAKYEARLTHKEAFEIVRVYRQLASSTELVYTVGE